MLRFVPGITTVVVGILLGASARAEAPVPPAPKTDPAAPPPQQSQTACSWCDDGGEGGRESLFSLDLMLGMETGVRAQAALVRRNAWELVGEGYYGFLLTKLGASEGGGLGVRAVYRRSSPDGADSLLFGPGFDLLYEFDNDHALMAAPSVDVAWLHGFSGGSGWETGLNVGAGLGVSGNQHNGTSASGAVTPLISIYTGLRF